MSTMIASKRMAIEVAEDTFNRVASQSTEYGGQLEPGDTTLVSVSDIDEALSRKGLEPKYWTPVVIADLAGDGVEVKNRRVCTPAKTNFV